MLTFEELEKKEQELEKKIDKIGLREGNFINVTLYESKLNRLQGELKATQCHLTHLKEMREKLRQMKTHPEQKGRFAGFCAIVEQELFGEKG